MLILASAVAVQIWWRGRMGGVIPIVAVVLAIIGTRAAGDRRRSNCSGWKGAIASGGDLVARSLPANAVLITVWQSGSVRFTPHRES